MMSSTSTSTKRLDDDGKASSMTLYITYLNVSLYALCFQLQRPVEPFLVQSLTTDEDGGANAAIAYGRLNSFFSLVQTVGSPLVGILLDRIGIRRTSALVFLASAASYEILAHAHDLTTLFLSKLPTALQHAFLVAQAAAAASAGGDDVARAQALGRMTTAYTVGATVGPALGGFLANGDDGDLYAGARLAVAGSLLSVVLSWIFLPDGRTAPGTSSPPPKYSSVEGGGGEDDCDKPTTFLTDLRRSAGIAARSHLWPLLAVKVIGGVVASMHSTALPLTLKGRLHFDPSQLGLLMSSSMFAVAAFGAVAIRPAMTALGSRSMATAGLALRAAMGCVIALIVGSAAAAAASASPLSLGGAVLPRIAAASIGHALASHALATSLTTQSTGAVSPSERGALLGLEHGLFSVARVVGPTAGAALLSAWVKGDGGAVFWPVAVVCGAVDLALIALLSVAYGGAPVAEVSVSSSENKTEHTD